MTQVVVLQDSWITFFEKDSLFSILVPTEMKYKEQLVETSTGDYFLNSLYLESDIDSSENYLYLINYHEIQEGLYSPDTSMMNEEFLQVMAEDLAANISGELLYTNPVHASTWSALDYRINFRENELNLKGKLIITPTHLFVLQVYSTKQYTLNTNRDKFLESFRLLN